MPEDAALTLRVTKLESEVADLQDAQRDDATTRGLVFQIHSSVDALTNGQLELARKVNERHKADDERHEATDAQLQTINANVAALQRSPVQAASPALALIANVVAQLITGRDAASVEAVSSSLLVLLSALFGPQLKERVKALWATWFPSQKPPELPPAPAATDAATKTQTNGVAPNDTEIH